jgi:hypothetical protein
MRKDYHSNFMKNFDYYHKVCDRYFLGSKVPDFARASLGLRSLGFAFSYDPTGRASTPQDAAAGWVQRLWVRVAGCGIQGMDLNRTRTRPRRRCASFYYEAD